MDSMMVLLIVAVLIGIFVVIIYNGIVERYNKVKRAWSDVIVQERQKDKIIPELERLVKQHDAYEGGLQTQITSLRSMMSSLSDKNIDTKALEAVEKQSAALMNGIHVAIENYPELKASKLYHNLMKELTEQQENVGAAIRIFNQNVEMHNTGIETFPNNLVNNSLNKKPVMPSFTDDATSEAFSFKPFS